MNGNKTPVAQGWLLPAQAYGGPRPIPCGPMPAPLIPGKGPAAVGVAGARQPHLCAVVDAGRAGQRHLHEDGQMQGAFVVTGGGDEPGRVVRVQHIELGALHRGRINLQRPGEFLQSAAGCQRLQMIFEIAEFPPQSAGGKEIERRQRHGVIHEAVKPISPHPLRG